MTVEQNHCRLVLVIWMSYAIQLISGEDVYTKVFHDARLEFSTQASLSPGIYYITKEPSGSGFTLEFRADNNENPLITSPFDRIDAVQYLQNKAGISFILRNTILTDAGYYTLKSLSVPEKVLADLTLIVLNKPDILPIQSVSEDPPTVGSTYVIRCNGSSTNQPAAHGLSLSYSWKEGGSVISGDRYTVTNDQLQINSVQKQDDQLAFTCQASETGGSITVTSDDSTPYSIPTPHYLPTVTLDPSGDYSIENGSSETFICTSDANPAASYIWKKGSSPIPGKTGSTYHFQATDTNQEGEYTCDAWNSVGTGTATVTVDIQYGPEFNKNFPSNKDVVEDNPVYVDCSNYVDADPNPTVFQWSRTNLTSIVRYTKILSISNTTKSDAGIYKCTVANTLVLTDGGLQERDESASMALNVLYGAGNSVKFNPPEVSYTFIENDPGGSVGLQVVCLADCNPLCGFEWEKLIDQTGQWQSWIGSGNLNISADINRNDHGIYRCRASDNITDSIPGGIISPVDRILTVTVNYKPSITEFKIIPTEVLEGGDVTFSCKADGRPDSTIELPAYQGDGASQHIKSDLVLSKKATCEDMMEFTCFADNSVGRVSQTEMLKVRCSPRLNKTSEFEREQFSAVGENKTIPIPLLAYPEPTVDDWIHVAENGTYIGTVTPRALSGVSANKFYSVLDLNNVQQSDFGRYIINMNNSEGKYNITLILNPADCPTPPTTLRVVETKHSAVELEWSSGYPNGDEQKFDVYYMSKEDNTWKQWGSVADSTSGMNSANILNLRASTQYWFKVVAVNKYSLDKDCEPKSETNAFTKTAPDQDSSAHVAAIAGGVVGGILAFVIGVFVIIFKRRRQSKETTYENTSRRTVPSVDEGPSPCESTDHTHDPAPNSEHLTPASSRRAVSSVNEGTIPYESTDHTHDPAPNCGHLIPASSRRAVSSVNEGTIPYESTDHTHDPAPNSEHLTPASSRRAVSSVNEGQNPYKSTDHTHGPAPNYEYLTPASSKETKNDNKRNTNSNPVRNETYENVDHTEDPAQIQEQSSVPTTSQGGSNPASEYIELDSMQNTEHYYEELTQYQNQSNLDKQGDEDDQVYDSV